MDAEQRYWAFISYSHEDMRWARWLHRALEAYRVPAQLVGRETGRGAAPARFRPIFRDRDDMGVDPDLRASLQAILARSANLIVICSPQAVRSPWVEDEILIFKRQHGARGVLPVIVAGEPNATDIPGREAEECFPRALRFHLEGDGSLSRRLAEPVAADLRPGGDGRRGALLKLLSGMLACNLDELVRRDSARARRQMLAISAGSLTASLAMAGLTFTAVRASREAQAERDRAEGLVEFMLVDLRKKLESTGRLDILDSVASRSRDYYASQAREHLDADALGRRARVLQMLGSLRDARGDLAAAKASFQEAARSTADLLARDPDNPARIFDHSQSVYWVGYLAQRQGRLGEAQAAFEAYRGLAQRLVAIDPKRDEWQAELVYADTDLGIVLLKQHHAQQAAEAFAGALPILRARAAAAPADRDRLGDLAQGMAWSADADMALRRYDTAMAWRMAERTLYEGIIGRIPNDADAAFSLVVNRFKVAAIQRALGHLQPAIEALERASADIERLIAASPDTVGYKEEAAQVQLLLARCRLDRRDASGAAEAARRSVALAEELARKDPSLGSWNGPLLGSARALRFEAALAASRTPAERRVALAGAPAEADRLARLTTAAPEDGPTAVAAARLAALAGEAYAASGGLARAHAEWTYGHELLRGLATRDALDEDSQKLMIDLGAKAASSAKFEQ